ncbi:serine protease snake-like isoform X2 [Schistocerca serialis cubense]|uniref:serine protease snake-like isoform X2 n=1 Tax=Schistocerca serialis cubense TaxID=2023355 RepID=UPI00214DF15B|nr:serine protease snake-like isoform X2 [Schistocerca serialis cubense]
MVSEELHPNNKAGTSGWERDSFLHACAGFQTVTSAESAATNRVPSVGRFSRLMTSAKYDVSRTRSVVSDMTTRRFLSRVGPSMWPSATIVLLLLVAATNAGSIEYELCQPKNGGSGKCLHISLCPSAIHKVYQGIVPDICGFQGRVAIVCCEDSAASKQLITGDQPSRKPEIQPNGIPESTTKPPNSSLGSQFQSPSTQLGNTSCQEMRGRISEKKGELCQLKNGGSGKCLYISLCPSAIHKVYKGIELDICGFQGSVAIVCCEDPAASNQLIAGDQPPRKPDTQPNVIPDSTTTSPNSSLVSKFQSPTTQSGNTSSQQIRKRVSEEKCDEYKRPLEEEAKIPYPLTFHFVVGGTDADIGEIPHMAAIGYQVDGNLEWNCGGSLISEYYVLTAAHCTHIGKYPAVIVRLGEHNLKSDHDGAHPVDYHIAELVRHPEYKGPSKYNDIALLRLSERVNFTWSIRPACLYTHDKFSVSMAVATGWGKTEYAGKSSDILQKVNLDIVDNEKCNNLWKSLGKITSLPHGIAPSMICAGVSSGDKDTCQGDSGGPLQMSFKIGRQHFHHVIGVTSFGNYCAGKDSPGVYTRVSSFITWIESIVWPDG